METILDSVKHIYFTIFLLFFRFCRKAWSDEMNVVKGVGGVTLVQAWLLVGIIAWSYYATGNKLLMAIPKPVFFLSFMLLFALNYYVLVRQGRAMAFSSEFTKFGIHRKVFLVAAAIGLIVFSVAFAAVSGSYVHLHRIAN